MLTVSHAEVRARAAEWVRGHFRERRIAALMDTFNLEQRTAERILEGKASDHMLIRMGLRFGPEFRRFVYGAGAPPAMAAPKALWFTPAAVHEAPAGHEIFARDTMGRPAHTDTDCAAYLRVNCGWVSATLTPGHLEVMAHDGGNSAALGRLRDWIATRGELIRIVLLNGRRLVALDAVLELERLAGASTARDIALAAGCIVDRRPLDSITAPNLRRIAQQRAKLGNAVGSLTRLLSDEDAMRMSAIFQRKPDGCIFTLFNGPGLGVNPAETMGKELSERPEPLYRENLRHRLEGALEEPTYHRLRLPVAGRIWDYESLAMADEPAADGSRFIATIVHIHNSEKVAA